MAQPSAVVLIGSFIAAIALIIAVGMLTAPLTPDQAAAQQNQATASPSLNANAPSLAAGSESSFSAAFTSTSPFTCTSTFTREDATFSVTTYVHDGKAAMVTKATSPTLGEATVEYVFTDRAYIKVTEDVAAQSPSPDCAWLRLPVTREPLPGVVEQLAGGDAATCAPALERLNAFELTGTVCDYNPVTEPA